MFLSDEVKLTYNNEKSGYELLDKLSYEDVDMKEDVPTLKDIGIHPYRWVRMTVPIGFIFKPSKLELPPFFNYLVDSDRARKSFVMYDYMTWKLRCYKLDNRVYDNDNTVIEAKKIIDNLFLDMLARETSKYPLADWKWFLIKFLVKNFNSSVLNNRANERDRIAG